MSKDVKFAADARNGLQEGLDTLANAVKVTLGPKGRHAAIERNYGPPLITKDGVTVARSIDLDDRVKNMGAQLIKAVAASTNAVAGDGTTTATVLAQAIYGEGAKLVAVGHNPVLIKRGIDKATAAVVTRLSQIRSKITDEHSIKNVAVISANNDIELGALVGEVVSSVGNNGTITVEDATGSETRVVYSEGVDIDRGYISPNFINNFEKMTVEFENPYILIYDGKISSSRDMLGVLQSVSESGRQILIIARDVDGEALQTLVVNRAKGSLHCCAIKAPGFGDIRGDMLSDLAVLCGAKFYAAEEVASLKEATKDCLGTARRVVVTKNNTTIIDGGGNQEDLNKRIAALNSQLQDPSMIDYQLASLRMRLSALTGAIAVVKVGGVSEAEMKERKDRVEDAINAVRAAIDEGIVSGGGSSLLHCITHLRAVKASSNLTPEEMAGFDIVERAIKAPFLQIMANAGAENAFSIMEKIIESENVHCGYDALHNKWSDNMIELGVIDPLKVVRSALQNAASACGTLLTTEVAIFNREQAKA
jgi:chaperonin GroEL